MQQSATPLNALSSPSSVLGKDKKQESNPRPFTTVPSPPREGREGGERRTAASVTAEDARLPVVVDLVADQRRAAAALDDDAAALVAANVVAFQQPRRLVAHEHACPRPPAEFGGGGGRLWGRGRPPPPLWHFARRNAFGAKATERLWPKKTGVVGFQRKDMDIASDGGEERRKRAAMLLNAHIGNQIPTREGVSVLMTRFHFPSLGWDRMEGLQQFLQCAKIQE